MFPGQEGVDATFIAEARRHLEESHVRLRHCVRQLDDRQLWWRPRPGHNAVANLVLHLCGNLRQRINSLIGGAPDVRDRPQEFAERGPIPQAELIRRLDEAVRAADRTLAAATPRQLTERRIYQGATREFNESVVGVILRTLLHLSGHAQEVVCLTRLQLGDKYEYQNATPPPGEQERTG